MVSVTISYLRSKKYYRDILVKKLTDNGSFRHNTQGKSNSTFSSNLLIFDTPAEHYAFVSFNSNYDDAFLSYKQQTENSQISFDPFRSPHFIQFPNNCRKSLLTKTHQKCISRFKQHSCNLTSTQTFRSLPSI